MEGRWTLCGQEMLDVIVQGPELREGDLVPVVPCDDAAVERARAALRAWYPSYFTGRPHKEIEVAERVIRALAGDAT